MKHTTMRTFIDELYPICRSIAGPGVRETLALISRHIPLAVHEIPTGTPAFDWTVPAEWEIRDAWIKNEKGEKIVDFRVHNLHIVNYSDPIHKTMTLKELKKNLHTLPDRPDWIPYRTAYYDQTWGFCLTHKQLMSLPEGKYEVYINAEKKNGFLSYGELSVAGETENEVLFSTHICHPSLANDNLSGIAVATWLAKFLLEKKRHYSYRFLFIPGTIGSLVWLSRNRTKLSCIKYGLVLTGLGDPGNLTYKKSRQGNAAIDRVVKRVLDASGNPYNLRDFLPFGYDERQFCSPGFDLPVGTLMRTPFAEYPQYHTSADNPDFLSVASLTDSLQNLQNIVHGIEDNRTYTSNSPFGEPQLGKRGLYTAMHQTSQDTRTLQLALLWVLNLSDGTHSLHDMEERSKLSPETIRTAAKLLENHHLITRI